MFGVLGVLFILLNLSSERQARQTQTMIEQRLQGMEDKSPEELGKMVGEFMKGMQEAQQQQ